MCNGQDIGLSYALRRKASVYLEVQVNERIADNILAAGFIPDILFLQIQNDQIGNLNTVDLLRDIVKDLKSKGCKVINWNGDIRGPFPHWMVQLNPTVNAFANMRDVNACANGKFLQIGIDHKIFKDWKLPKTKGVVFMANHYGSMFPEGQRRMEVARVIKRKFGATIYGTGWPKEITDINLMPDPKNPIPKQSEESKVYNASKIAINHSHFDIERYTSDRLFRCMASKVMVVSHHYKGIEYDFEVDKHLVTYKSMPEMEEKIRHYLDNDDEREIIALAGYKHVHKNFRYEHMAENILKL